MTLILDDTFTEASDTRIDLHTGETGATWAAAASDTSGGTGQYPYVDSADELRGGNTVNNQHFYASGVPGNADQKVTATFLRRGTSTGQWSGVCLRMDHTAGPGALNAYILFYINTATPYFRLYKLVAGAGTQLGSDYVTTLASATPTDVDFYAVGSSIKAYLGSTLMISATDSAITSAGRFGVRFSDYALTGAGAGVNFSRLQGWDSATLPSVPSATPQRRRPSGLYIR